MYSYQAVLHLMLVQTTTNYFNESKQFKTSALWEQWSFLYHWLRIITGAEACLAAENCSLAGLRTKESNMQ